MPNFDKNISTKLKRKTDANKGDFGHALIIGGDHGMGGAAIMAAEAAYRIGAGKVSVLTHEENITALLSRLPNAMSVPQNLIAEKNWKKIFAGKTVIVIGPGLGKSSWSKELFLAAMNSKLPKVIDADALNLISESKKIFNLKNSIITPHPGEAARLLGVSNSAIQKDRKKSAKKLFEKFGAITVLKGKGSLICGKNFLDECKLGNPGMAVAGMGDVLSGLIAGLVAQGLSRKDAAILGVEIHALAGDLAAKKQGEIGMIPTDLFSYIPLIIKSLNNTK